MKEDKWITIIDSWEKLEEKMSQRKYFYPIRGILTNERKENIGVLIKNIRIIYSKKMRDTKIKLLLKGEEKLININSKNIFVLKYGRDDNGKAIFIHL